MPDWRMYVRDRLRLPGLRPEREAAIVEDLAQQLEDAWRAALARGASADQAEAEARSEIRDWDRLARDIVASDARHHAAPDERVRERLEDTAVARTRPGAWLTRLAAQTTADVLYAFRVLFKNPGFTAAVLVTLALGIGANAAVFTILNSVLLRPLPYADPDRLVRIWEANPGRGWPSFGVSQPNYLDWRAQNASFEGLAATAPRAFNFSGAGEAQRVPGLAVTHDFLPMLGIRPAIGRGFLPAEDAPGAERVALITRGLWERSFGGDPAILGRAITLNDTPYTVVGVVPESSWRPYDVFVPLRPDPAADRSDHRLSVYGKLKPGVALAQGRSEMEAVAMGLARRYPDSNGGWTVNVTSFYDWVVPEGSRRGLYVLSGAVALVLVIACANVAGLLLARAAGRRREIAIRAALGAGRARLVRQLLAESIVLALAGGALGLMCAQWGLAALGTVAQTALPRADEISLDHRVLLFTLAASLVTGLLFGIVPALQATRVDFHGALKEASAGGTGARQRGRSALVVVEVSLSLMLLVGVGLLLRSLLALTQVQPGFDTARLLTASVNLSETRYPKAKDFVAFQDGLLERLRALPGVLSASVASGLPMDGNGTAMEVHAIGAAAPSDGVSPSAQWRLVSPGYFRTMGIRLRGGRDLNETDVAPDTGDLRGVVISEELARRCWPGQDPIGRQFHPWSPKNPAVTVVGLVDDVLLFSLEDMPTPTVYLNYRGAWNPMQIILRTAGDPMGFAGLVRGEVRALDPGVPVGSVRTLEDLIDESTAPRRVTMTLLAIFAGIALVLAGVGLFGLMAHLVAQRTHDIGIRMALGASRRHVFATVVGRAMLLTGLGIAAGSAGSFALARTLRGMLFGVGEHDALTLAVTVVLLVLVGLTATSIRARRAARIDPIAALRCD